MLLADPGVSALVGARVYSRRAPQGADYPAVTLRLDVDPEVSHQGRERLDHVNLYADCWARDEPGVAGATMAMRVANAVVDAMAGKRATHGGVGLSFGAAFVYDDGLDAETGIYSVAVELSGWARSP